MEGAPGGDHDQAPVGGCACWRALPANVGYDHQIDAGNRLAVRKVVTVWFAIDDVDAANGAMMLWPGSHRGGVIPFEYVTDEEEGVLGQRVHQTERFGEPVSVELRAGQMSLHTDMLLHGSSPNTSGRRRCGLTIRYVPPDVRRGDDQESLAIIARGSDPQGYWQPIPRPKGEAVPA